MQQLAVEPEHRGERGPRQQAHAVDDRADHGLGIVRRPQHGAKDLPRRGEIAIRGRQLGFEGGDLCEAPLLEGLSGAVFAHAIEGSSAMR